MRYLCTRQDFKENSMLTILFLHLLCTCAPLRFCLLHYHVLILRYTLCILYPAIYNLHLAHILRLFFTTGWRRHHLHYRSSSAPHTPLISMRGTKRASQVAETAFQNFRGLDHEDPPVVPLFLPHLPQRPPILRLLSPLSVFQCLFHPDPPIEPLHYVSDPLVSLRQPLVGLRYGHHQVVGDLHPLIVVAFSHPLFFAIHAAPP